MYGKVFESMFDGTLASRGPWQALVTFQQLIVLSSPDGVVDMTAHAISRRTSIPLDIIETGIAALMTPDPESRTPDEEGRRIVLLEDHRNWGWQIVNHRKYQALRNAEERREYMRVAQATRREKLRLDVVSTPVNTCQQLSANVNMSTPTDTDTSTDTNTNTEEKEKALSALVVKADSPPKAKPKREKLQIQDCPEDVEAQVWIDWIAVRVGHKAQASQTAINRARKEAAKANLCLNEFLEIWCARGSRCLEASWLTPQERATGHNGSSGYVAPMTFKQIDERDAQARVALLMGAGAPQQTQRMDYIDMEADDDFSKLEN